MTTNHQPSTGATGWIGRQHGQLLDRKDLMAILGCSQSTITRMTKKPGFPAKRKLGARSPRWVADEIETWIDAQREAAA